MMTPLQRERTQDFGTTLLGPGWLRQHATTPDGNETPGPDVWRTGPGLRFRDALVGGLDGAREVALVCSFLLAEDALAEAILRACKRGVRVYVLTSSEQRLGKEVAEEEGFEQRMVDHHKALLASLSGNAVLRSASHFHAKFLVVDPGSIHTALAWLSTANFNKALQDSVELGVQLRGGDAVALAECFQWAFWCEAERELQGPNRLVEVQQGQPGRPARHPSSTVRATFQDGHGLREEVLRLIEGAQREVQVASYGVEASHPSVQALVDAARRGVRVTFLTRPRPKLAAGLAALAAAGVTVLGHDKLHAKALVVDDVALVMSANLEAEGLDTGFEVGAVLRGDQATVVKRTLLEWAAAFPWKYRPDATRGEHLGEYWPVGDNARAPKVLVTQEFIQDMGTVTAGDALHMEDTPLPDGKVAPREHHLPQQVRCRWTVLPPTLPHDATELFQKMGKGGEGGSGQGKSSADRVPYKPRVFQRGSQKFVLLEPGVDEAAARSAAATHAAVAVLERK